MTVASNNSSNSTTTSTTKGISSAFSTHAMSALSVGAIGSPLNKALFSISNSSSRLQQWTLPISDEQFSTKKEGVEEMIGTGWNGVKGVEFQNDQLGDSASTPVNFLSSNPVSNFFKECKVFNSSSLGYDRSGVNNAGGTFVSSTQSSHLQQPQSNRTKSLNEQYLCWNSDLSGNYNNSNSNSARGSNTSFFQEQRNSKRFFSYPYDSNVLQASLLTPIAGNNGGNELGRARNHFNLSGTDSYSSRFCTRFAPPPTNASNPWKQQQQSQHPPLHQYSCFQPMPNSNPPLPLHAISSNDVSSPTTFNNNNTWLILRNLTPQVDASTLKTLCLQHGPLQSFYLNLVSGFAIACYSSKVEALRAEKSLNGIVLWNTTLYVQTVFDVNEVEKFLQHFIGANLSNGNISALPAAYHVPPSSQQQLLISNNNNPFESTAAVMPLNPSTPNPHIHNNTNFIKATPLQRQHLINNPPSYPFYNNSQVTSASNFWLSPSSSLNNNL